MSENPKVLLKLILESIGRIEDYLKTLTFESFLVSEIGQDSIIRRLEIIGETIKSIPEDFVAIHPEILWRKYPEMSDKLIHEYFGVDLKIVWKTAKEDLPKLKEQIKKLIEQ